MNYKYYYFYMKIINIVFIYSIQYTQIFNVNISRTKLNLEIVRIEK